MLLKILHNCIILNLAKSLKRSSDNHRTIKIWEKPVAIKIKSQIRELLEPSYILQKSETPYFDNNEPGSVSEFFDLINVIFDTKFLDIWYKKVISFKIILFLQ